MVNLLIGAIAIAALFLVIEYARRKSLALKWWHWALTVLGLIYAVFVLEVIATFLQEGAAKAALVVGMILLIIAVTWGVLMARLVFNPARRSVAK